MGCGGLLASVFIVPIVLLLVCGIMIFSIVGNAISNVQNGGIVSYDEATFQEYADSQYKAAFGDSEDNILIVFLTNEEADGYYTIAWVGDNVNYKIRDLFGAEGTEFGSVMISSINNYHAKSISADLATVMRRMSENIQKLELDFNFESEPDYEKMADSRVVIRSTTLDVNEKTVNAALEQFTADTGIPAVIVVDTMENVFGKTIPTETIMTLLILAVVAVVAIVMLVKAFKNRRAEEDAKERR